MIETFEEYKLKLSMNGKKVRCKKWKTCKLCKKYGCSVYFYKTESQVCPFDKKNWITCPECGMLTKKVRPNKIYCSERCRNNANHRRYYATNAHERERREKSTKVNHPKWVEKKKKLGLCPRCGVTPMEQKDRVCKFCMQQIYENKMAKGLR